MSKALMANKRFTLRTKIQFLDLALTTLRVKSRTKTMEENLDQRSV